MPKFRVMVIRPTTQYAFIEVEADDESVAEEEAQIRALQGNVEWELSTEPSGAPYVLDDETEEVDA